MKNFVRLLKFIYPLCAVLFVGSVFTGAYLQDGETSNSNSFTAATWTPTPTPSPSVPPGESKILITEVYYRPASDGSRGDSNAEWVELYNAGTASQDLAGWILWDNTSSETISGSVVLDPGEYALISASSSTWDYWSEPLSAKKIIAGGTKIFNGLADGGDRVVLFDSSSVEKDAVSWGTDSYAFFPSLSGYSAGNSAERSGHSVDTDTASDWFEQTNPTPGA